LEQEQLIKEPMGVPQRRLVKLLPVVVLVAVKDRIHKDRTLPVTLTMGMTALQVAVLPVGPKGLTQLVGPQTCRIPVIKE
tara:strand:- start:233 stop:472 length:240 start_codon:yes stop_codon:yes gene_type:complete